MNRRPLVFLYKDTGEKMGMIIKVITKRNWGIAKTTGEINEESFIKEGFIHCSLLIKPSFKSCSKIFQS